MVKGISVEKEDGTYNITPAVIKNVTIIVMTVFKNIAGIVVANPDT